MSEAKTRRRSGATAGKSTENAGSGKWGRSSAGTEGSTTSCRKAKRCLTVLSFSPLSYLRKTESVNQTELELRDQEQVETPEILEVENFDASRDVLELD